MAQSAVKIFEYPEYHTSLDDFNLVTEKGINGGLKLQKKLLKFNE